MITETAFTNQPLMGFINIDKPIDVTSHDCVAKVRRWAKMKRVGHGGTLDPAATGVLPLAVGKATRLLQFLPNGKAYQATIRLGWRTSSDDLEGEIIEQTSASHLTLDQVKPHLQQFLGKIIQIPPVYSAIQKDGKRLYELARQGKSVDVPPREVEIDQIEILNWQGGEFPELTLEIRCKSGTYIRSIARDLGKAVGTGGTLSALRRTKSSGFSLEDSFTLPNLETELRDGKFTPLPLDYPLQHLERIDLDSNQARRWCQGQFVVLSTASDRPSFLRVYREDGLFLGVGEKVPPEILKPKTVMEA
ncbi:tRNA pseudouridine(55) synthase TruB [Dactylococcopsis salina]|uniref:tRNA pseudouridine synthase B n=2 Tax=Dactylococcopsis salina TaxID=292566 RepID=K9YRH6_DACS8|nr:tRNA pseudouridine(55) synthase TruB [Dactylococcopsis salina]AFZ48960.1 tRNA pseudouridine 55 synthase [Dactylococcopsis salina PCC 8305]